MISTVSKVGSTVSKRLKLANVLGLSHNATKASLLGRGYPHAHTSSAQMTTVYYIGIGCLHVDNRGHGALLG